jgi:predicted neuraminidase
MMMSSDSHAEGVLLLAGARSVTAILLFSTFAWAGSARPKVNVVSSEFVFQSAPFKECHASTIVELSDGDLLVAWFAGSHEGDQSVAIWGARRSRGGWTLPEVWAREPGAPCWNPVLFRDQGSRIWLFYKVGPSPETWSGAYKTSAEGKSWSAATYLPAGLLGPIKNKPILLASGDIVAGTSVESYNAWSAWVEISRDQGQSWHKYGPITVPEHNRGIIQPTLWESAPGHLKMLVRATQEIGSICEASSEDGGETWTPARPTALPNPNSGIDATSMANGTVALVYNHSKTGRSPLNLAFSRDNGATWLPVLDLETEPGEYSYPAIIQTKDGLLHITYTWRRIRIKHVVIDWEGAWGDGRRRQ